MLACVLLLSASLLGMTIALRIELPLRAACRLGVGLAVGQALLMWTPFLIAAALNLGAHDAGLAATALLAGAGGWSWLALQGQPPHAPSAWLSQLTQSLRARRNRGLLWSGGALAALFCWLLQTHFLMPRPDGPYSASVTWGDLPMHLGLVTRFLYADGLPALEHPLYLHGPLVYPFLPDYDVAVLAALGLSLRSAFILSGALSFVALVTVVHALARYWLDEGTPLQSALALWLFFLAGGLGFGLFVWQALHGGAPLALVTHTNFTYLDDDSILKAGHIGNLFIAARTATPGMAIGGAALLLLGHARERSAPSRGHLVLAGAVTGSLPLVHGHSFIALCLVTACYALLDRPRDARFLWVLGPLALAALPQLLWLHDTAQGRNFLRIAPGFLRPAASLLQWATDVTLGLGFGVWLLPLSLRTASARTRQLTLPLLWLLPLTSLVTFTPTLYDNIKLLAWFDLAGAVLLAGCIARALTRSTSPAGRTLAVLAVLGCTFSGALAVAHELTGHAKVVSLDALRFVELVRAHTAPSDIIATAGSDHDPVAMFSGRRTLVASPYILPTHGIRVRERAIELVQLYAGGAGARAVIDRLGVSAVVVSPRERADLPIVDERWIASQSVAHFEAAQRTLYLLRR